VAEQLKIVIDADVVKAMGGLKQLEKSFKNTENSAKSFGANVAKGTQQATAALAKVPNTANSATLALSNIGRVAQDLPFGFLGIANNLNPLLESFQRLKAESGSTKTALKALGSSLLGAGGLGLALSVASSLLIVFGDKLFGAGKKTAEAARAIKSSFEVIGDATDSVQGDIANVGALVKAATDTGNSLKIQGAAIAELKKINKEFFGGLQAGKSSFEDITIAANNYTQSLITQAIVKGLQDEISELAKQIRAATKEYNDLTAKTTAASKAVNNYSVKAVRGEQAADQQASSVNDLSSSYEGLNKKLQKSAAALGGLKTQFNSLSDEINKQVLIALKIKPPPIPDIKDQTNDILARARQFVKEFGDVFVVPDLEETFFRGVKQLLPDAKKLLENAAKGNLKIKIPVTPEIEFLSDGITPLSKEQLDDLTKRFFSESGVPVDIVIDPSLSLNNTKLIDEKLKLKQQFEDTFGNLGVKAFANIDFTNLTEGIAKATQQFANMKLVLDTLTASVSEGLSSAFNNVFDAILEGKNVFKALGESVKALVVDTIKAIAKMFILRAVTAALGGGGAVGGLGGLIGGFGRGGSANFGLGGAIGNRSFQNTLQVVVTGQISGSTINLAGQRAAISSQRGG
jgi:hypothetical protein